MTKNKNIRFLPIRCPVCNGLGKVNWGKQICHACGGVGVVVVDQQTGRLVGDKNENVYTNSKQLN